MNKKTRRTWELFVAGISILAYIFANVGTKLIKSGEMSLDVAETGVKVLMIVFVILSIDAIFDLIDAGYNRKLLVQEVNSKEHTQLQKTNRVLESIVVPLMRLIVFIIFIYGFYSLMLVK